LGNNNNEGFSKYREDEIAESSRIMTNDFECSITKVCVSKHYEEGIANVSRYVLNVILSIMNVCLCIFIVVCIYVRMCLVSFGYVTLVFVRFVYLWLGFVNLGYVWLCFVTFG